VRSRSGPGHARLWLALVMLLLAAPPLLARQTPAGRSSLYVPIPGSVDELSLEARTMPGSTAGSPTAYGPGWGDGYVGVGFVHRARYAPVRPWNEFLDSADGAVSVGFGVGNALELIGLDVNVASYSTVRRGFGNRVGVSFKAHRVLPNFWGVAVGYENAIRRGGVDAEPSLFAVVSKVWYDDDDDTAFHSLTASVGVGNGRFRREADIAAGRERINVFAAAGVQVFRPLSVLADWTGQDLAAGISLVPFMLPFMPESVRDIPFVVTLALADLTGTAGDGARLIVGGGLGFRWDGLMDSLR